ncbi:MAG TPA: hypothetical protein OIM45_02830 [Clostridiaceae bacterium]|nr:hypothetical protein [Clostridiaceae bacterium]
MKNYSSKKIKYLLYGVIVILSITIMIIFIIMYKNKVEYKDSNLILNESCNISQTNDENSNKVILEENTINIKEDNDKKNEVVEVTETPKEETRSESKTSTTNDNSKAETEKSSSKTNIQEKSVTQTKKQEETKPAKEQPKQQEKTSEKGKAVSPSEESKKEEKKIPECSGTKHFLEVGNTGKWFNSKAEAVNYFDTTYSSWAKKWENLEIDDTTFYKNCPTRYEVFQCICGKWTMNFFYD